MIGELEADDGAHRNAQEHAHRLYRAGAPSGTATPFETVLAGDVERAALMEEADHCADPDRLGELHGTADRDRRLYGTSAGGADLGGPWL